MKIKGYEFEVTEFVTAGAAERAIDRERCEGTTIVKAEIVCLDWTGHQTHVVKLSDQQATWYL